MILYALKKTYQCQDDKCAKSVHKVGSITCLFGAIIRINDAYKYLEEWHNARQFGCNCQAEVIEG